MQQIKKYSFLLLLLILIFGASSCGLFKGKNKCGDCPTWSQNEMPQSNNEEVNV